MIKINELQKSYGRHQVLKGVSMEVAPGEIVGLIGPNGSGKSTLMKCLCGLIFFDGGSIEVSGCSLANQREKAVGHLSAVIENPGYYPTLTGMGHLKLIAGLRGASKQTLKETAEFTGLKEALKRPAGKYSLGMKQRLALGMAILSMPSFLVLDEPMNGLDPGGVFELRRNMQMLKRQRGMGILFSSHQLGEIEKVSDRILFLRDGAIVQDASSLLTRAVYRLETDFRPQTSPELWGGITQNFGIKAEEYEGALLLELDRNEDIGELLAAILGGGHTVSAVTREAQSIEALYRQVYNQ